MWGLRHNAMGDSCLVWVQCGLVTRATVTAGSHRTRIRVRDSVTWSPAVIASLMRSDPHVQLGNDPTSWAKGHEPFHYRFLGLALIRGLCSPNPCTYLSPGQREVKRYWGRILQFEAPLFFLRL